MVLTIIKHLKFWVAWMLVFLLPLFFLPITTEFYEYNKMMLLFGGTGLLLILTVIEILLSSHLTFHLGEFDPGVLFIALVGVVSLFLASVNKSEALTIPLGVGSIIAFTLLYFLLKQYTENERERIFSGLLLSSALVAVSLIMHIFGITQSLGLPDYVKNNNWNPTGSVLTAVLFIAVLLPVIIFKLRHAFKSGRSLEVGLFSFASLVSVIAIVAGIYQLLIVVKPALLPQQIGWAIALEVMKVKPLFGVGAENFLSAFTSARPLSLNATPFWNLRFIVSSSTLLHILTVFGLVGLAAWVLLHLQLLLFALRKPTTILGSKISFLLLILFNLLLPPFFLGLFLLYILLALLTPQLKSFSLPIPKNYFSTGVGVVLILIVVFILGQTRMVYAGELAFKSSLDNLRNNKGVEGYNLGRLAISRNSSSDIYRLTSAQTNVLLALALAQKKDISDQDKQNIVNLLDQARKEGTNAVNLNPTRVSNWEGLARIYRSLLSLAKGADQGTFASYDQAIRLDPFNPLLRIEVGQVLYGLGKFDEAISQFQMTVQLKGDFANGYYNLASAYKAKKDYTKALSAMQVALTLLEKDTPDYKKVDAEIADLKKQVPETETKGEEQNTNLSAPKKVKPVLNPPVELPAEENPATKSAASSPKASPQ